MEPSSPLVTFTLTQFSSAIVFFWGKLRTDVICEYFPQPPLVQCHVDPGRHIVTNELFPMVSAMLTARGDGNGGNVVAASAAEILGLAVLLSVVGSVSWLRD